MTGPISRASSTPMGAFLGRPCRGDRTVAATADRSCRPRPRPPRWAAGLRGRSISTGPRRVPRGSRGGRLHAQRRLEGVISNTPRFRRPSATSRRSSPPIARVFTAIGSRGIPARRSSGHRGAWPAGHQGADFTAVLEAERLLVRPPLGAFLPASLASQWSKLLPAGEVDLAGRASPAGGRILAPTFRSAAATSRSPITAFPTGSIGPSAPSPTGMACWRRI